MQATQQDIFTAHQQGTTAVVGSSDEPPPPPIVQRPRPPIYGFELGPTELLTAKELRTIVSALHLLEKVMRHATIEMNAPQAVRRYLELRLAALEREVFVVLFLDAQHRLISADEVFRGTLKQTSVYPREIIKRALALNAGAVILAHNHPSGVAQASAADRLITDSLKTSLAVVDVRVLDHLIIAGRNHLSFAERGWI